jgi:hypothetical protein
VHNTHNKSQTKSKETSLEKNCEPWEMQGNSYSKEAQIELIRTEEEVSLFSTFASQVQLNALRLV